jgi:hypothetical protein
MRLRAAGLGLAVAALVMTTSGCGDDHQGGGGSSSGGSDTEQSYTEPTVAAEPDPGCEDVIAHPIRVPADPPYVVACSAEDGLSLHVENVSAEVLRFSPTDPSIPTEMALDETYLESPGVEAARAVTGSGWDMARETFVLPLGGSLTASSDSRVSLHFESDLGLSAEADVARYVADWAASKLRTRGQALAERVQSCATSAAGLVADGEYVEDVLRSTLGTQTCYGVLKDVLEEQRVEPTVDVARARSEIFRIARPALEDQLVTNAARLLAHR